MPGEDPANNPDGCEEIGDDDLRADTDSFWGGGERGGILDQDVIHYDTSLRKHS